ncbi:hypothetical protein [Actinophytocola gossypii]|uniref:ADP ribosyltransferase domain-containing protein n=1 Tax=Actinophytocola gossypii TaxID=2812003 RepID=A0ABT2J442_9PSEU|nr:hypothetical protein [Actinophytocola gossypii]MCT2582446.1 hypothetical protein [Actinophytocola gossypii]
MPGPGTSYIYLDAQFVADLHDQLFPGLRLTGREVQQQRTTGAQTTGGFANWMQLQRSGGTMSGTNDIYQAPDSDIIRASRIEAELVRTWRLDRINFDAPTSDFREPVLRELANGDTFELVARGLDRRWGSNLERLVNAGKELVNRRQADLAATRDQRITNNSGYASVVAAFTALDPAMRGDQAVNHLVYRNPASGLVVVVPMALSSVRNAGQHLLAPGNTVVVECVGQKLGYDEQANAATVYPLWIKV